MSDSTSVQPILDAADQAAAIGDIAAAGDLLQQAVHLQEAHLGPNHPDLANTLNNLGVACEKTGRLKEAAACYRRAHEIAAAAFEPDHPFVVTSRKNLAEFYETHGKVMEPMPVVAPAPTTPPPALAPPITPASGPATGHEARSAPKTPPLRIAAVIAAVIVVVALGALFMRRPASPDKSPRAAETPSTPAAPRDAAASNAPSAAPDPGRASNEPAAPSTSPGRGSAPEGRTGSTPAASQPTVARAQVCRRLSQTGSPDWKCEPAGGTVAAGTLVYYTRIKATSATTVEHRWYHGGELQQRVRLDVSANSDPGYRTFSRLTIGATGRWRVELRSPSGTLLHEEQFTVR
jgi:hypothetical protein